MQCSREECAGAGEEAEGERCENSRANSQELVVVATHPRLTENPKEIERGTEAIAHHQSRPIGPTDLSAARINPYLPILSLKVPQIRPDAAVKQQAHRDWQRAGSQNPQGQNPQPIKTHPVILKGKRVLLAIAAQQGRDNQRSQGQDILPRQIKH